VPPLRAESPDPARREHHQRGVGGIRGQRLPPGELAIPGAQHETLWNLGDQGVGRGAAKRSAILAADGELDREVGLAATALLDQRGLVAAKAK
jgi:hypothetical protein